MKRKLKNAMDNFVKLTVINSIIIKIFISSLFIEAYIIYIIPLQKNNEN